MQKIIEYVSVDGQKYKTEKEAIFADNVFALKSIFNEHIDNSYLGSHNFLLEEWIKEMKQNPQLIRKLLELLEFNVTKYQVDLIHEAYNQPKCKWHVEIKDCQFRNSTGLCTTLEECPMI